MSTRLRRAMGVVLVAGALMVTQTAGALSTYPPGPTGRIGISRPTISRQFVLDSGEKIRSVQMWVDEVKVNAVWDGSGLVSYSPTSSLAAGVHAVKMTVTVAPASAGFLYDPITSAFTFTVAPGALATLVGPGPEERQALTTVNQYRTAAGLSSLTYDLRLGAAAAAHGHYLSANPAEIASNPHAETPETPDFVGATVGERTGYFGYTLGTGEVINYMHRAEDAISGWMETPYHRIPLIHPGAKNMGYGAAQGIDQSVNVLVTGSDDVGTGIVLWPFPDQTDVPTGWSGKEHPDPFRLYPEASGPVGYTITMTFGGRPRALTLRTGTLSGPNGDEPVFRYDPVIDAELTDSVALIPKSRLAPAATYTAHLTGDVDFGAGSKPFDRTWKFTTASEHHPRVVGRVITTGAGGQIEQVLLQGDGFSESTQLYLAGVPVSDIAVLSDTELTFHLPKGYHGGQADLLVEGAQGPSMRWANFFTSSDVNPSGPRSGSDWAAVPLLVNGTAYPTSALRLDAFHLAVPESALAELGAKTVPVDAIGRRYLSWGARTGEYTLGETRASIADLPLRLKLPALRMGGITYVDVGFVQAFLAGQVNLATDSLLLGMPDIAASWAHTAIIRLVQLGIVSGGGDGLFRPNDSLTRAAFVKLLVKARGIALADNGLSALTDTAGHWVATQGYLGAALQSGIVVPAEYPGGQFQPDRAISREEMAVMVTRALGFGLAASTRTLPLPDGTALVAGRSFTDAAEWGRPDYIAVAVEQGIITGYAESGGAFTFQPRRTATRAEAATMIIRTMDHVKP